jgi:hypothetical protein
MGYPSYRSTRQASHVCTSESRPSCFSPRWPDLGILFSLQHKPHLRTRCLAPGLLYLSQDEVAAEPQPRLRKHQIADAVRVRVRACARPRQGAGTYNRARRSGRAFHPPVEPNPRWVTGGAGPQRRSTDSPNSIREIRQDSRDCALAVSMILVL